MIVLLWIGGMKFTSYEAAGIAPLEMHSPLMNWLYVLMGQRNVWGTKICFSCQSMLSPFHGGTRFESR